MSGTCICLFSLNTAPGKLWPPIRSCDAGTSAPIRLELAPAWMILAHSLPLATKMDTLEASNRRLVISTISWSDGSSSPGALATARKISALACCCIFAAFSWTFSRAVSDAAAGFRLREADPDDFALRDPGFEILGATGLRARDPARPAPVKGFLAFPLALAIQYAPWPKVTHPPALAQTAARGKAGYAFGRILISM